MTREILIGGSGKQASAIHLPVLLEGPRREPSLAAIADPIDPRTSKFTSKYAEALNRADTRWVPLGGDMGQDLGSLTTLARETPSDTLIISCPPLHHGDYVAWGVKYKIKLDTISAEL